MNAILTEKSAAGTLLSVEYFSGYQNLECTVLRLKSVGAIHFKQAAPDSLDPIFLN